MTFYLVPVKNAAVLKRIEPQRLVWKQTFPLGHQSVYVFTQNSGREEGNDLRPHVLPRDGARRDPGTGAAAAALIGLLARYNGIEDGQQELVLRQGHEMGRPCRISIQVRKAKDKLTHGGIGGHAVIVGEGGSLTSGSRRH